VENAQALTGALETVKTFRAREAIAPKKAFFPSQAQRLRGKSSVKTRGNAIKSNRLPRPDPAE
jgi:hypothetical protein